MKKFTHLLRVRYSECDAQKVVFNAKYAEFVDVAATEFIREIWGNYNDVLAQGLDSQVVSLSLTWKAPAKFDDVLAIEVSVTHIGTSSYTLEFKISDHATGNQLTTAIVVYVMVNATRLTKVAIPDDLRRELNRGASGVIVNHAGI